VADCKTPGEAAQRLNEKLFPLLKVRYATDRQAHLTNAPAKPSPAARRRAAACPSCLVDACRSVGVPARVAGTPMWSKHAG